MQSHGWLPHRKPHRKDRLPPDPLLQLLWNLPQPQTTFLCSPNTHFKAQLKPTHFGKLLECDAEALAPAPLLTPTVPASRKESWPFTLSYTCRQATQNASSEFSLEG